MRPLARIALISPDPVAGSVLAMVMETRLPVRVFTVTIPEEVEVALEMENLRGIAVNADVSQLAELFNEAGVKYVQVSIEQDRAELIEAVRCMCRQKRGPKGKS